MDLEATGLRSALQLHSKLSRCRCIPGRPVLRESGVPVPGPAVHAAHERDKITLVRAGGPLLGRLVSRCLPIGENGEPDPQPPPGERARLSSTFSPLLSLLIPNAGKGGNLCCGSERSRAALPTRVSRSLERELETQGLSFLGRRPAFHFLLLLHY